MSEDERIDLIMDFEDGTINEDDALKLFSDLIKTGLCWSLQGVYGRTAQDLINKGYINKTGKILKGGKSLRWKLQL